MKYVYSRYTPVNRPSVVVFTLSDCAQLHLQILNEFYHNALDYSIGTGSPRTFNRRNTLEGNWNIYPLHGCPSFIVRRQCGYLGLRAKKSPAVQLAILWYQRCNTFVISLLQPPGPSNNWRKQHFNKASEVFPFNHFMLLCSNCCS